MSHSRNEHLKALIDYLPGGRMYSSALRTDSNLYKFLYGLSSELKEAGDLTERYRNNVLPDSKSRGLKLVLDVDNLIESPKDLTDTATWTETGTSVAAFDAVGLEGEENTASTLTDDDGLDYEFVQAALTIPNDSNTNISQAWIKKDNDESRFPEIQIIYSGGTSQSIFVQINTKTGATVVRGLTGVGSAYVIDQGEFWNLIILLDNNNTGNTSALYKILPAAGSSFGSVSVSATGSCIIGFCVFNLNSSTPAAIFEEARGTDYDFLEEWERVLGIPDSCFPGDVIANQELRRIHVLAKLASLGVQTEQDFIDLATLFGLGATISHTTKFEFDVETTVLETVSFPLVFPILFSVSQTGVYQCLVQLLKPANTEVTFSTI